MTKSLEQLRQEIDRLDDEMIRLLNQRAELAVTIGTIKRAQGDALYVPSRERNVLDRLVALNKGPLSHRSVCRIYGEIMAASLAVEHHEVVLAAGEKSDVLQAAVRHVAGDHADVLFCTDAEAITSALERQPAAMVVLLASQVTSHQSVLAKHELSWRGCWRVADGHYAHAWVQEKSSGDASRPAVLACLLSASDAKAGFPPAWLRELPVVSAELSRTLSGTGNEIVTLKLEASVHSVRTQWAELFAGHCDAAWILS